MNNELKHIQDQINSYKITNPFKSLGELNDTYHSFDDLYKQRTYLLALLCMRIPYSWKSLYHEDGSNFLNMFIVGFPTPTGMVTYHCDLEYWNLFKIPILHHAPHFDGYTDQDCLDRIEQFIKTSGTQLINSSNIESIEQQVRQYILPTFYDDEIEMASFIGFYNK